MPAVAYFCRACKFHFAAEQDVFFAFRIGRFGFECRRYGYSGLIRCIIMKDVLTQRKSFLIKMQSLLTETVGYIWNLWFHILHLVLKIKATKFV